MRDAEPDEGCRARGRLPSLKPMPGAKGGRTATAALPSIRDAPAEVEARQSAAAINNSVPICPI